jgi:endo-1,4-beta-D-glucanase Y
MSCTDTSNSGNFPPGGDGDSDGDSDGDVSVDESLEITGNIKKECSTDGKPFVPFGSRKYKYVKDSCMVELSNDKKDEQVKGFYDKWKAEYLGNKSECGDDRYFVDVKGMDGHLSISEGHGYGMIIMAYMAGYEKDAKKYFDGMYKFFKDHPSTNNGDLMAWAQGDDCKNESSGGSEADSATDGDMDIAYALLLSHKLWGSSGDIDYLAAAEKLIDAIYEDDVAGDGNITWIQLGDWVYGGKYQDASRSSDFMPGHLASFENLKKNGKWKELRNNMYQVFADLQNEYTEDTGLFPDFITNISGSLKPAEPDFHEGEHDGDYFFNACRVPWRLGVDYLTTGNKTSRDLLARMNSFFKNNPQIPDDMAVGYRLDGTELETDYTSWAFIAPSGVGAMVSKKNQGWLNATWNSLLNDNKIEDDAYFENTLKLISLIAMSGNWWRPEAVDC